MEGDRRRGKGRLERRVEEKEKREGEVKEEGKWRRLEQREEKVRRERERKKEEKRRRGKKRRKKNVIWRGIEGKDQEERRGFVEGVMEREIGRVTRIKRMEEEKRGRNLVLITEMEELEDKDDILKRGGEIKRKWGWG